MKKCKSKILEESNKLDYKSILKNVGLKIREERKAKKISQEKLGFISNLDRTYIGSVERVERNISVINLYKIASALDITVKKFFD